MPMMLQKHGRTISYVLIFLGIGLIGIGLLTSNPTAELSSNTILVRSTGGLAPVLTADQIAGNILQKAGIRVFPGDRILIDGQRYQPEQKLLLIKSRVMQFIPAARVTVQQNGKETILFSSAPTLGQALMEAGYRLNTSDRIEPSVDTQLVGDLQVAFKPTRTVNIEDGKKSVIIHTSAETVEAALAKAGFSLTALDNTEPAADQLLPDGKPIKILRNHEEIVIKEKAIPFENEQVIKAEMDQGTTEVVQAGQAGLEVTRERVRYTNGKETGRQVEETLTLRDPIKQITNVGNKVVASSVDTGIGSLDYYRTEQVYATSYSPCRQGYDHCSTGTASGIPLKKGVVAVTQAWYKIFGGTQVYIPGYGIGTIADTGGGIPGKFWIDLGYGEDDFVGWHQTVTIYFLNPAPANVPEVLP